MALQAALAEVVPVADAVVPFMPTIDAVLEVCPVAAAEAFSAAYICAEESVWPCAVPESSAPPASVQVDVDSPEDDPDALIAA